MFRRLAGVLLGKTSFDSLYGLIGPVADCGTVPDTLIRSVSAADDAAGAARKR
jgi:hypothetical protein